MGPTTKAITVTGGVTLNELREAYYTQAKGLVEGGVDLLLVETCQNTREYSRMDPEASVSALVFSAHRLHVFLCGRRP